MKQRLAEAENQLKQAETLSLQREEEKRELEALRRKIEQTDAKIDAIQDEQGSNLESEAELRRLKEVKKDYHTDLENKKKELDSLTKQTKNREKEQAKVDRLRASLAAKERNKRHGRKAQPNKTVGRPERAGKRAAAPKRGRPGDNPR